jgi:glycosyltransferase involved in cell wall biosynthesis
MEKVYLSTVTPVFQGAGYLAELVEALAAVRNEFASRNFPIELTEAIFVNDEPIDDSAQLLERLRATHSWVKVVQLSRNFGQHPATVAGILHSAGDWVATLDEDLQHHPRLLLPLLLHCVTQNLDVVYARAESPVHQSGYRDFSSRLFKALVSKLTGNPHVRKFNSFRVMRGSIGRAAAAVSAHDTYFDISVSWFTNRIGALPLPLKDRRYIEQQKSGYGVPELLAHGWKMMASSELRILRVGATLGVLSLLGSFVLAAATIAAKILFPETIPVPGWTSLLLVILFFGGLISFLAGIGLELITALVVHAKGKPAFFVIDRSKDDFLRAWAQTLDRR